MLIFVCIKNMHEESGDMVGWLVVFAAFLFVSLFVFKERKTKKLSCILLGAILLVEIFVMNFNAVRALFQKEEVFSVSVADENVSVYGNDSAVEGGAAVTKTDGSEMYVTVDGLDCRVVSVTPVLNSYGGYRAASAKVTLFAADDSYSESFRAIAAEKTVSPTAEPKVLPVELTGNCRKFRISVASAAGTAVEVTELRFNEKIPFAFSVWRLIAAVSAVWGLYALIMLPVMRKKYSDGRETFRKYTKVIIAVSVMLCITLSFAARIDDYGNYPIDFSKTDGNQITKELVDAFESGHLYLAEAPSDELLSLDNPYDWSQRSKAEVTALWDHLLYEGKYYSYYGIAPVLLLFLPFHAVTGVYFASVLAVLLFSVVGVVFLILLFREYAERFCKSITLGMLVSALLIIVFSSGIWYSLCFSNFYEIAQSAGFMFTCAGFFFLLRSNVAGGGKIRKPSLAWSSAFMSLAVLSRPTLALYCVTALVFIWFGLKKNMSDNGEKMLSKGSMKYLCCALIPYAVFGGLQCAYNFARFGSPLDFGIQYSLTINDFTRSQFYADFFNISFHNFILAFPVIKSVFPFVSSNFSRLGANGYYFIANENAVGIFWRALTSLGLFGIAPAYKKLNRDEKRKLMLLMLPVSVVAPLVIIFSIWESGYGVRYCADFSWQIILGGTTVLFIIYDRICVNQTKRLLQTLFPLAALLSLTVNFALLYEYCDFSGYLRDAALAFADSLSLLS